MGTAGVNQWRGGLRSTKRRKALAGAIVTVSSLVLPVGAEAAIHHPAVMTTVAGTGSIGSTQGPGRIAVRSQFGDVVAYGSSTGSYLIAERDSCKVRAVNLAGQVSTIAGTGTCGYSGDGVATDKQLGVPAALARATDGSIFVAERSTCLIRKIDPAGATSTIGGLPPDPSTHCGSTGDNGQAQSATFNGPAGLAFDTTGGLLVAERTGCRVRRLAPVNGAITGQSVVTTFAGNGTCTFAGEGVAAASASLNQPTGLAVDTTGRVYVADAGNHRVRRVASGQITTLAGTGTAGSTGDGGAATSALLNQPVGISIDGTGAAFIADNVNCRIRRVDAVSGSISTVVGGTCGDSGERGAATSASIRQPSNVDVTPGGDLVISDPASGKVKVVNGRGAPRVGIGTQQTTLTHDFRLYGNSNSASGNWSGGDATYSIPLPDGQSVAWLFADSFVNSTATPVNTDHSRGVQFINNQLVVQDLGSSTGPSSLSNRWRTGAVGQDYFPDPNSSTFLWPSAPFYENGTQSTHLTVLLREWNHVQKTITGMRLAKIPLTNMSAPTTPQAVTGAFPTSSSIVDLSNPGCGRLHFGDAVVVNPDGSGYTYIYGVESCVINGLPYAFPHVARVMGTDLVNGLWQYYTGGIATPTWSSNPEAAKSRSGRLRRDALASVGDAGYEFSVTKLSSGGYRLASSQASIGQSLATATSPTPWGPFAPGRAVYTATEAGDPSYYSNQPLSYCHLVTYNGKEHPELATSADDLVFTYNVHSRDQDDDHACTPSPTTAQVDNYRPRFVRNTVTAPSAPFNAARIGAGEATVYWSGHDGSLPTTYTVTPYIGATAQPSLATTVTGQNFATVTGLQNGTAYKFQVTGTNAKGTSQSFLTGTAATPRRCSPYVDCAHAVDHLWDELNDGLAANDPNRAAKITALDAGQLSLEAYAASLYGTTDWTNNVHKVIRLYHAYFLRMPDVAGFNYWVGQLRAGLKTIQQASADFAASSEFGTRYGALTHEQFVERIYKNVLDREGSQADVDWWTARLVEGSWTRGRVMEYFANSSENTTKKQHLVRVAATWLLIMDEQPSNAEWTNNEIDLAQGVIDAEGLLLRLFRTDEFFDIAVTA